MPSKEQLQKYANILIRIGLNVQPGQRVAINAPIDSAEFVRLLVTCAYDAGASTVNVDWKDPLTRRIRLERESEQALQDVPKWMLQKLLEECDRNTCFLYLDSTDPDLMQGVDANKMALHSKALQQALKPSDKYFMEDRVTWLVCAMPSKEWAQKMFPDESAEGAVARLWETILKTMRMDEANPVQAWSDHLDRLEARAKFLNEQHFVKLHYRSQITDMTVELVDKHFWQAARSVNAQGSTFVANMPTEEVYTLPKRDGVNGKVKSTMPLAYEGVIIDEIELTFKDGRIVDFNASSGYDALKNLIETDDGSHYLGEIALVPVQSPISNLNTLFYNTLFDENASCHIAIGEAYPTCLVGGKEMTEAEVKANGANMSLQHVDFMIGSPDLDIDGYLADGTVVPVFRAGNWAI